MQITFGGVLYLIAIALIIVSLIFISRWRSGGSFSLSLRSLNPKNIKTPFKPKIDDGTVLCLNVYPDKIIGEYMLRSSVNKKAYTWEIGSKKYLMQYKSKNEWEPLCLPSIISYPTERLARMMECPLTKLKSLKFHWYEHAAPFAPVAALGIGVLMWVLVL